MIVAAIDIGSNSVRLLVARVADGDILPISRGTSTTRLIGGMGDGMLLAGAVERTYNAVAEFARRARLEGAERVYAFATSAMRDARNREVLLSRVRAGLGMEIEVLSGEEEAAYAYMGAALPGRCGVLDIGGGSTEMLVGQDMAIGLARSAPIGAVRLMEAAGAEGAFGPIGGDVAVSDGGVQAQGEKRASCAIGGAEDIERVLGVARAALRESIAELRAHEVPATYPWVGVGGTITSLAAMDLELAEYDREKVSGYRIAKACALKWLGRLLGMTPEARRALPGLQAARADIIPYGVAILCAFMGEAGVEWVTASDSDNLEGCLRTRLGLIQNI